MWKNIPNARELQISEGGLGAWGSRASRQADGETLLRDCLQVSEGHGEGHDGSYRDSTLAVTERLEAGGGPRRWQGSGKCQRLNWKMEESRRERCSISSPSEALSNRLCVSLSSTPPIPKENQGATSNLTIRKDSEWMNTGGRGEEK